MFVFNLAGDFLDNILDRNQTFGAVIFVKNDRQMGAGCAHFCQQIEYAHGFRNEARLPEKWGYIVRMFSAFGDNCEDILDMDHADNIVEILAIDRNAAMAVFGKNIDKVAKRGAFLDSDHVGPGNGYIVNPVLAEMQHIAQHFEFQR